MKVMDIDKNINIDRFVCNDCNADYEDYEE